jgi:hypothetical protein
MRFLQNFRKQGELVIPGKRSADRNPVPLGAGFKEFWIPAFARNDGVSDFCKSLKFQQDISGILSS